MESAYHALSRAIRSRAVANPNTEIWNTRAFRGQAPAKSARPYLVYVFSSGIKPQNTKVTDAEFIVTVKCVAGDVASSEAGAARINELFDDLGQNRNETLDCGSDWMLINSQLQRYISLIENVDGAVTQIYHDGGMFRFLLERKTL